jgi:hypothetical protein
MGSDGTTFQNAGQCVSYAAHGGTIVGLSTCVVTSTTGCLTFNGAILASFNGTGHTFTLTGATSFVDACSTPDIRLVCGFTTPNALATGGGDYVERDSAGNVISQGQYRIADTAGSQEGLAVLEYLDANGQTTTCALANGVRSIEVGVTLIDSSTGATQDAIIAASSGPNFTPTTGSVLTPVEIFAGSVPDSTITC